MPEISIIVPVYKVEKYLHRCVDSILAQTFTDFELLLIDDGSPDLSGAICDEYAAKDDRIRVFHKENGGVSSARNLGLDKAQGKYIMFCDSDDAVDPQWCEVLRDAANFDIFPICSFWNVHNTEKSLHCEKKYVGKKLAVEAFPSIRAWAPWRGIFRRDIIEQNNLCFDEDLQYSEDLLFVFDYIDKVKYFQVIPTPLYYYYIYNDSLSHKKYIPDYWKAAEKYFKKCEKYSTDWSDIQRNQYYMMFFDWIANVLNNTMNDPNRHLRGKIQENNKILQSDHFDSFFPYANKKSYVPLYLSLLKTKNYFWIWLLGQASNLKHKILHR